jgi:hypothetical protein
VLDESSGGPGAAARQLRSFAWYAVVYIGGRRMTRRRTNSLLYGGAAALGAAAVVVVVFSVAPLESEATSPRGVRVTPVAALATTHPASEVADLAALEPVLSRPLRGPAASVAHIAPPTEAHAPPPPVAAAGLTLVGTIGDSTALLRGSEGTWSRDRSGSAWGGAEVIAVRGGEAQVRIAGGRVVTLRKSPATTTTAVTP